MIQVTLIQIDNYGPWTVTLKPKREADLQILQSLLYSELQDLFSSKGGLVFYSRFDNLIAISNGIDVRKHKEIQEAIKSRFPITISFGIGAAKNAYDAQILASKELQKYGSSRSEERREIIAVNSLASNNDVQIAHIDINGISKSYTDSKPAYDNYLMINEVMLDLIKHLKEKKALLFYIGGDNFMSPCNGLKESDLLNIFEKVYKKYLIELKAGIGIANSADKASRLSDSALEKIRKREIDRNVFTLKE
jgi:GTP cyclohydrolase IIa